MNWRNGGLKAFLLVLIVAGLVLGSGCDSGTSGGCGEPYQARLDFDVLARGSGQVPMIGDAAPASKNLTKMDVKSLDEIDSARPHDDMHDLTIADAVKSGKPTVVLFATPGFCESL